MVHTGPSLTTLEIVTSRTWRYQWRD